MRVLLVDDSVAIQKVAKLGLGAFPAAELRICDSVGQAEAAIGDFAPQLFILSDAIALDSEKSERSEKSQKALEKILKSKSNVIVLTESPESEDRLRAQGYPALLRKPFKLAEFRELVEELNGQVKAEAPAADVDDSLPELTLDLKALTSGTNNQPFLEAKSPDKESVKRIPEARNQRNVPSPVRVAPPVVPPRAAAPVAKPTVTPPVDQATAAVATPVAPRRTETPSSRVPQPVEAAVRVHVEQYLNQNWAMFTKSLTAHVQKSIQADFSERQVADLHDLRQSISNELGSLIRSETEAALRGWMGEFSRDVLKEVAREELLKLLESDS